MTAAQLCEGAITWLVVTIVLGLVYTVRDSAVPPTTPEGGGDRAGH